MKSFNKSCGKAVGGGHIRRTLPMLLASSTQARVRLTDLDIAQSPGLCLLETSHNHFHTGEPRSTKGGHQNSLPRSGPPFSNGNTKLGASRSVRQAPLVSVICRQGSLKVVLDKNSLQGCGPGCLADGIAQSSLPRNMSARLVRSPPGLQTKKTHFLGGTILRPEHDRQFTASS